MKKKHILTLSIIIFSFLIFIPNIILAIDADWGKNHPLQGLLEVSEPGYGNVEEAPFLGEMLGNILKTILSLLGIIFLILILISGYQWMMAGGNEETITKAKKRIMNATIGLAVVILSYSISYFIMWVFYYGAV